MRIRKIRNEKTELSKNKKYDSTLAMKTQLKETQEWKHTSNNASKEAEGEKRDNIKDKKEMKLLSLCGKGADTPKEAWAVQEIIYIKGKSNK